MQYDFNLPANGGTVLEVRGKFFKYRSGTGMIRVRSDNGGFVDLLPGQGVWNTSYSRLNVTDKSGAANAGVLLCGDFDFHDDRISGTVDVIDGGRTRSLGGQAYLAYGGAGGIAGNYAIVQLFNPAGSGRNLFIEAFQAQTASPGAGGMAIRNTSTELTLSSSGYGTSKKIGAANSLARIQSGNVASIAANTYTLLNLDKSRRDWQFKEPIFCAPGTGVFVFNTTTAEDMGCGFEFFEEMI